MKTFRKKYKSLVWLILFLLVSHNLIHNQFFGIELWFADYVEDHVLLEESIHDMACAFSENEMLSRFHSEEEDCEHNCEGFESHCEKSFNFVDITSSIKKQIDSYINYEKVDVITLYERNVNLTHPTELFDNSNQLNQIKSTILII